MKPADPADIELDFLVSLFYEDQQQLGQFSEIPKSEMPESNRDLLAHNQHMTVTVEQFHECPVDVQVLKSRSDGNHYSRKIVLNRKSDSQAVMFGIVHLNRSLLLPEVCAEIDSQQTPLGHILIRHNVLREVKLLSLLQITAGGDLATILNMETGDTCFGRTAMIYCDGAPAIELLEIVG